MVAKKSLEIVSQRSPQEHNLKIEKDELLETFKILMEEYPFQDIYKKIREKGDVSEETLTNEEFAALSGHIAEMIGVPGLVLLSHTFSFDPNTGNMELYVEDRTLMLDMDSKVVIEEYDDIYDIITTKQKLDNGRTLYRFETGEDIEYPILVPFSGEKSPILWVVNGVYRSFTEYFRTRAADERKRKAILEKK